MYLRTLGRLALDGSSFKRQKPLLFLAYLALNGSVSRRRLAELFWPEAVDSGDSLSSTLRRLRRGLGPEVVEVRGQQVWSQLKCDALELQVATRDDTLQDALKLYRGPFLDGLTVPLHEEIEEWVFLTREKLAEQIRQTGLRAASRLFREASTEHAMAQAEALIDLDATTPWQQETLQELMDILRAARSGRLTELMTHVGDGDYPVSPAAESLPAVATLFVGRTQELSSLRTILHNEHGRLVTLHGPGGVGKSRLALEVARLFRSSPAFSDGTHFVSLDPVPEATGVAAAIAGSIGLPLPREGSTEKHVIRNIGNRRMLLVLDNFEHLMPAATFLSELLRHCAGLRILVTSRNTLELREEHVEPLSGLPVDTDAVRLLQERALQRGVSLTGDSETLAAAQRFCELVEGSPLAIELGAAQTAFRSIGSLVEELEVGLDVLVSTDPAAPARHRSLSAALDVSWRLLSHEDAEALAKSAVFRGGFDRSAAHALGISDASLTRLIRGTHLRLTQAGRFSIHPLVRQDAESRLLTQGKLDDEARNMHAAYYLTLLTDRDYQILGGPDAPDFVALIDTELPNIRVAWEHGMKTGAWKLLAGASPAIALHTELRGHYSNDYAMRARAIAILSATASTVSDRRNLAAIQGCGAYTAFRMDRFEEALNACRMTESHLLGTANTNPWSLWAARQGAGLSLVTLQRFAEALSILDASLAEAPQSPSSREQLIWSVTSGTTLVTRAFLKFLSGDTESALSDAQLAFSRLEKYRAPHLTYAYWLSGMFLQQTRQLDLARHYLEEGIRYSRATGFRNQLGYVHAELARVHLAAGRVDEAMEQARIARHHCAETSDGWLELDSLALMGTIALAAGDAAKARQNFLDSMKVTSERGSIGLGMEAVLGMASLCQLEGQLKEAVMLLAFVARSGLAPAAPSRLAEKRLHELAEQIDTAEFNRAVHAGSELTPEEVLQPLAGVYRGASSAGQSL